MITLITPTRDRSRAFGLLEGYMARQTYTGPVQWIVVNDGQEPYRYTAGQEVVIRSTADDHPDHHSITYNYRAALPLVKGDKVFFIEDDDWYHPDYLKVMSDALADVDLVGLAPAYYYHVTARKWRNLKNDAHASLAATGITSAVIPQFERATHLKNMVYLDAWLWPHWSTTLGGSSRLLPHDEKRPLQVGLKGLPWGCRGIGLGHDPVPGLRDINFQKLKTWLPQDWKHYAC